MDKGTADPMPTLTTIQTVAGQVQAFFRENSLGRFAIGNIADSHGAKEYFVIENRSFAAGAFDANVVGQMGRYVAFGARDDSTKWTYKFMNAGTYNCNTSVMGGDSDYGVPKAC